MTPGIREGWKPSFALPLGLGRVRAGHLRRNTQHPVLTEVIATKQLLDEPATNFAQGQSSVLLRVVLALGLDRIFRGSGQKVALPDHRSDQSLDRSAVMRTANGAIAQIDAVLGTAALKGQRLEVLAVVDNDFLGLAVHRPIKRYADFFRWIFQQHGMCQAQRDRKDARRLEANVNAQHATSTHVDRHRQPRAANVVAQWLIRPRKNVQRRVINLDPIEWIGRFHMPRHRLVVVFRFLRSFTTPHGIAPHERVDAALDRHHSRRALADRTTVISNPLMQGSERRPLALQVVRVEPFSDDALYLGIQHRRTHPTTADPGDHAIDGFMAEVVRHQAPNLPFAYSEFTRFRFDCLCAPNGHLDHLTHRIGTCHGLVPDCILDFGQRRVTQRLAGRSQGDQRRALYLHQALDAIQSDQSTVMARVFLETADHALVDDLTTRCEFKQHAAPPGSRATDPSPSPVTQDRSEEHTSELKSLMRISYAVFCLKKKNKNTHNRQMITMNATRNM